MSNINTFTAVCTLCLRTGFRLNTRQINVLRNWIAEGHMDIEQLADAVVRC